MGCGGWVDGVGRVGGSVGVGWMCGGAVEDRGEH